MCTFLLLGLQLSDNHVKKINRLKRLFISYIDIHILNTNEESLGVQKRLYNHSI